MSTLLEFSTLLGYVSSKLITRLLDIVYISVLGP